jgi:hypothetical protein
VALTAAMNAFQRPADIKLSAAANLQKFNELKLKLATQISHLEPHWKNTFKHYYIQKLHANIRNELAKTDDKNLFITRKEMINSFELQVLDAAGNAMGSIYKLALK